MWEADLTIIERELTLAGVNPALDALKELAAELRASALDTARDTGRALAAR
jgi:FMN-dependent NADH-azoreductase